MKNVILSSVVMALLVFSGCGDKEPEVDTPDETPQEVVQPTAPAVEEVATEQVADIEEEVAPTMNEIEEQLSTVYFDFDKFDVSEAMQEKITLDAGIANAAANQYKVKLEGNCDEWGSDEYNFALGLKRATAVKKALEAQGVDASRIVTVSYGETNQACQEKTQECWAQNRRVDFKLLPQ